MNRQEHRTFRLTEDEWQLAKRCMRDYLEEQAAARKMTSYSELEQVTRDRTAVSVEAWSVEMNWMLGEIADDCHEEGLPLLTAIVTHRTGDMEPGAGFYEKACALGYSFPANEGYVFWATATQDCFTRWGST